MRKLILIGAGGLVALLIVGFLLVQANRSTIIASQIERQVGDAIAAQQVGDEVFEIIFCGTGSPQFQPDRGQPCTAIVADEKLFVFDTGQGAAQGLQSAAVPFHSLEAVFLTHLHSDHMSGLGDVLHNSWLYGRQQQVEIVGPPGTERLRDGVAESFAADLDERWNTLGSEYSEADTSMGTGRDVLVDSDALRLVYEQDGIRISAFRVEHPNWAHAYGYKFEYQGKAIVISGDTRYAPNLIRHAQDVDILIHEALNVDMMQTISGALRKHGGGIDPERMNLIISVHTPTDELAKLATEAEVDHLVLTHLIPPIPANGFVEAEFTAGMDKLYEGDITVARDGMRIDMNQ